MDRTRVEHFAVTCCEQSNKMCDSTIEARCIPLTKSTFVSYVIVSTMYVASCLARQLMKI